MHQHQERSTLFDLAAVQAHRRKLTAQQQASSTPAGLPSTSRPPIDRDLMYKAYQMRLSKFFPSSEVQQEKQSDSATSAARADVAQTTLSEQDVQGKDNWQEKADTNAIFSNGSSLPSALMAKYEHLMPGVSLGHVSLHQGSMVDAALSAAGLHGLTDGTNVAVASNAPAGTLEHEIGHVGQRQEQGFSLNEGNRLSYETDADNIAAKLSNNQPVERFGQTASAKKRLLPSQMLEARMMARIQARCAKCDSEEQQAVQAKRGMEGLYAMNYSVRPPEGDPNRPCFDLLEAIEQIANELKRRYDDMLADQHNLYYLRRLHSDPPLPDDPGAGSWEGHQNFYNQKRDELAKKLDEFIDNDNCDDHNDPDGYGARAGYDLALEYVEKDPPEQPLPKQQFTLPPWAINAGARIVDGVLLIPKAIWEVDKFLFGLLVALAGAFGAAWRFSI